MGKRMGLLSRREVLVSSAFVPLAFSGRGAAAFTEEAVKAASPQLPPALYTLSVNIEQLFPAEMTRDERMKRVAAMGEKAFSFWRASEEELNRMLDVQQKTGLACGSLSGNGPTPRPASAKPSPPAAFNPAPGPQPMIPGTEKEFLEDVTLYVKVAKRFGNPVAILLFGGRVRDMPWETQRNLLVSNLRKAADIGGEHGIVLAWEVNAQLALVSEVYAILEEINHPNMKFDFDVSMVQGGQGNITTNLKQGLAKNLIPLFENNDVPGRPLLGTGELDWANIFFTLRKAGYKGWVGTEHTTMNALTGKNVTPEEAIAIDRKFAFA